MIENKVFDTIQSKDNQLDKNNLIDEKEIIRKIKLTEEFFIRIKNKSLNNIKNNCNENKVKEFVEKSNKLHGDFSKKLKELESKLNTLGENEEQEYQRIMQNFDEYVNSLQSDGILGIDYETEKSIDNINDLKDFVYKTTRIDKDTEKNSTTNKFIKGILDSVVMSNIDLLHQIYETKGKILLDLIDYILSWDGLSLLAEQLGKSVADLFSGDPYETGKAIGDLGMTFSGGALVLKTTGKVLKLGMKGAKYIAREGIAGLTLSSAEFTSLMERLPANAKKVLEYVAGVIKSPKIYALFGKEYQGRELELINKYVKAFFTNQQLLAETDHAYMSSSASYMLLKDFKTIPADLDIAVNPNNFSSFYDSFLSKAKNNPDIKNLKFQEIAEKGSKNVDIGNKKQIMQIAENGKWKVSYEVEGLEIELFPEKNGKGLTNLGYMDKNVVKHELTSLDGKEKISIPSLDQKGVAEGYVINFLNEFGDNSVDGLMNGAKVKDAQRLNNMYLLLKGEGIIHSPDDLVQFTQSTVEKYRNTLQTPVPYVKQAIAPNNVKKGVELLEGTVKEFKDILDKNIIKGKKGELPSFDTFILDIVKFKQEFKKMALDYSKGLKTKGQIKDKIGEMEEYIEKINNGLISEDKFMYYYEIKQFKNILQEIEKNLNFKIN